MNEIPLVNARLYAARRHLELAEPLGSGKDGTVWVAKNKDKPADVAIKALRFEECYQREKQVYQRLESMAITVVQGFNVPKLIDFDDRLLILEMTIVRPPFVLDFAGAYLDAPPQFPGDALVMWENEKKEQFEGKWRVVEEILVSFENVGIYLLDLTPANIKFLDDAGK